MGGCGRSPNAWRRSPITGAVLLVSTQTSITLAPSILSADFSRLGDAVAALDADGRVGMIHVDIMDGHFVPNITFGPMIVEAIRRHTRLPLDVHLMISQPWRYLEQFVRAGADTVTVHVETCPHLHRDLATIRELGARSGVALNPATSVSSLDSALDYVDQVLVMTVDPGFGGQPFIPQTVEKIARVRDMIARAGRDIAIEVDGGINAQTAPSVVAAGARILVAGSAVFQHPGGLQAGIDALLKSAATSVR